MGSSRLPGKVLLPVPDTAWERSGGSVRNILDLIVYRLKRSSLLDCIVIATTTSPRDDVIRDFSDRWGITCFRGDENDVLGRVFAAAEENDLDVIVRVPGDKPFVEPSILDEMLEIQRVESYEFLSNFPKRSFPAGLELEVFSFKALSKAHFDARNEFDREHVTPFIYRHFEQQGTYFFCKDSKLSRTDIRLTLDTSEDYALICTVLDYLGPNARHSDIVNLFEEKYWLQRINEKILQATGISDLGDELERAIFLLQEKEMHEAIRVLKLSLPVQRG